MKLKPLMPSQRDKKRYVRFRILSSKRFQGTAVEKTLTESFTKWVGQKGIAKSAYRWMGSLFDANTQEGVIKVTPGYVDDLRASFLLTRFIDGDPCIVASIRTSGAINNVKQNEV